MRILGTIRMKETRECREPLEIRDSMIGSVYDATGDLPREDWILAFDAVAEAIAESEQYVISEIKKHGKI